MPEPMAARSAATLRQLAMSSATTSTPITHCAPRSNLRRTRVPRLSPVANAVRSQISCTAYISGNDSGAVHSRPTPNAAPACE